MLPLNSHAGAWLAEPGQGVVMHNFSYEHYNSFRPTAGGQISTSDFVKVEYKPYVEYGLTENYSAGFSPSFQYVIGEQVTAFGGNEDTNSNLAYTELFLKRRLFKSDEYGIAGSISPVIELPGDYDEAETPFFGKKESFWAMYLSLGTNTYNQLHNYGYFNIDVGYRARVMDELSKMVGTDGGGALLINSVISFPIYRDLETNLGLYYTKSTSGYETPAFVGFNSRYGYDSTKVSLTQVATYGSISVEYGYIAQVRARNAGIGNGIIFSVSHKF